MPLGQLDSTPIVRVNHKTGRFESAKATAASISGRVMAIHYGRKKFTQDGAGKWSLECVSRDCHHGDANNGDTIPCMGSAWCRDCKSTLVLAMSAGEGKALILETSSSVATTIRDRLAPVISRGVAMDAVVLKLHLGVSSSARMTFAQCSAELTDTASALAACPPPSPERLDILLGDFADYIRSSFAMRTPQTSRTDLSGAELSV